MRFLSTRLTLLLVLLPCPAVATTDGYLWRDTGETLFALAWEGAKPVGELGTAFGTDATTRGLQVELRRGVFSRTSIGLAVAWDQLHATAGDGIARRLNDVSSRATFHHYLTGTELQPYVGLGLGVVWQELFVGTARGRRALGLGVDPQVGLLWTISRGVALNLLARYQLSTRSLEMGGTVPTTVKLPQWAAVELGIAFY